jgi:hypothetical protein
MTLYATTADAVEEKLTDLVGLDPDNNKIIKISDKLVYFGELKAWKRTSDAVYKYLKAETIYTKAIDDKTVGKFIYNQSGDLYVVSDDVNEYYYFVKSYDETSGSIVVSYDTYENIKSGSLSNDLPLGDESISYERSAEDDLKL